MAETDKDQKTEAPTPKKLEDALKKGDTASAPEVKHGAILVAVLIVTGGLGADMATRLSRMFGHIWGRADDIPVDNADATSAFTVEFVLALGSAMLPMMATLTACAIVGGLLQGRPNASWSRLKPNFKKLLPHEGLKKLFGPRALVEFAKTLAKLLVVMTVAWFALWPKAVSIDQIVGAGPAQVGAFTSELVFTLVKAVAIFVAALALFDFVYQRHSWIKRQRMSLQEIKDEHKNMEGDPKIKQKVRQIQQERARGRMMQKVPDAAVVITNPTHYAVALQYDGDRMAAPVVVAKGTDNVALKIREIAGDHGIPVMESPPLARALYAAVDLDHPIPVEHYAAVAEIIGHVMKLAKAKR